MEQLRIDPNVAQLIYPMGESEFSELETDILNNGCTSPLVAWRGILIDGHKRYEICTKRGISFSVKTAPFRNKIEALLWVCETQYKREDIPHQMSNYLIGAYYRFYKQLCGRQSKIDDLPVKGGEMGYSTRTRQDTIDIVAQKFHISSATVRKYARFAVGIDKIESKVPGSAFLVLSNQCAISFENLHTLSQESASRIEAELNMLRGVRHKRFKMKTLHYPKNHIAMGKPLSVKDMPAYDPDRTFTEMSLTIPSWSASIIRTKESTNFKEVSSGAKQKMLQVLMTHRSIIESLIVAIMEV